jgi:hypothetical protein
MEERFEQITGLGTAVFNGADGAGQRTRLAGANAVNPGLENGGRDSCPRFGSCRPLAKIEPRINAKSANNSCSFAYIRG